MFLCFSQLVYTKPNKNNCNDFEKPKPSQNHLCRCLYMKDSAESKYNAMTGVRERDLDNLGRSPRTPLAVAFCWPQFHSPGRGPSQDMTVTSHSLQAGDVKSHQARWFKKKAIPKASYYGWSTYPPNVPPSEIGFFWAFRTSQFPCHLIPCAAVATPAPATAGGAVCSTWRSDSGRRSERWVSAEIMRFELSSRQWKQNPTVRFHEIVVW